jgi:hypothetical protein
MNSDRPSTTVLPKGISSGVLERYRCPEEFLNWDLVGPLSSDTGFFSFGGNLCFGRSAGGNRKRRPEASTYDALADLKVEGTSLRLPFDPTEIIQNYQLERYCAGNGTAKKLLKQIYYVFRPLLNVAVRSKIQQFRARNWQQAVLPKWPVDTTVEDICEHLLLLSLDAGSAPRIPFVWFWPRGAASCIAMTHDVETETGRDFCEQLMDLNDSYGIKSSFQLIPETRYEVSASFVSNIKNRGFEVAVHDLYHDGRLYDDYEEFLRRAGKINHYLAEWGARGFRAGALYRNPDWFKALNISYEMSVPNAGQLDPQSGGCCTVMPYFIGDILELPVTAVQDYMLFHLLHQSSTDLWKTQIEKIIQKHGLVSFIVHPDYILEPDKKSIYAELLEIFRRLSSERNVWVALPGEIDAWWRRRSKMQVVKHGDSWKIEGEGSDDAVLAYATKVDGKLVLTPQANANSFRVGAS